MSPSRVIDISVPNGPTQHVYPGDPPPRVEQAKAIRAGDVCNVSLLTMGSHTGTHVDAPYHFIDGGARLGEVALERGIRAVGIDYLSIEQFGSSDFPVHHRLLGAGVFVIEGLDLRAVEPGRYTLVCLPLKFPDLDGAPARAVLLA